KKRQGPCVVSAWPPLNTPNLQWRIGMSALHLTTSQRLTTAFAVLEEVVYESATKCVQVSQLVRDLKRALRNAGIDLKTYPQIDRRLRALRLLLRDDVLPSDHK